MQDNDDLSEINIKNQKIIDNKELNIFEALIPVVILMALLAYNIFFADGEMFGEYSNQYILLIGGFVAFIDGLFNKVSLSIMLNEVWENLKSILIPVLILFLVGALAGTWLISGVIPAMIYYPVPLHQQKAYIRPEFKDEDYPITMELCKSVISLPIHTEMDEEELKYITESVKEYFNK